MARDYSIHMRIFALSVATLAAGAAAWGPDPTSGFVGVPLTDAWQLPVQRPYDVPLEQRYELAGGGGSTRRLWVYCTDKPHSPASHTKPRTEIRMQNYSSGVWQFEAYTYVPAGTTGTSVMQVFGSGPGEAHTTTLMLHVYDGALRYYDQQLVEDRIYNRWFRLNVIHDIGGGGGAGTLVVFVDGQEKLWVAGRGGDVHYFKFGVYAQENPSHLMESRWRDVRLFVKP